MELTGKVIVVYPVKEGVGKTSGNPWKTQEFVIETREQYPKKCCLQVMNDNVERFALQVGMEVHVKFDITAREWEGRYFNTLTAWEVTVMNPQDFKKQPEK